MTHTYTISELADAAGVTPRTIRYYTAEGLLPPPEARGKYALYTDDHRLRLELIARLKGAYLPLSEIRARVERLSTAEVQRLLEEGELPQPQPAASASEYIARVLARRAPAGGVQPLRDEPAAYLTRAEAPNAEGGTSWPAPAPAAPLPLGFAGVVPAPAAAEPTPPGQGSDSGVSRLASRRVEPGRGAAAAAGEQWQRIGLAPGVELHMREPVPPGLRARLGEVVAQLGELLDEPGDAG
jgi:DNA-binding transcriptional MerR regulator